MTAAYVAAGLLFGAIVGSFLATLLMRWPAGRSVLAGRSRCDGCGERLRWIELIPIASFLRLRGRCARCRARIDPRHFAVEIAGAAIGGTALLLHPGIAGAVTALLGWWLLLILALDAEHLWLPDQLVLPLLAAGLATALLGIGPGIQDRLIGAAAGFVALWAVALVYRKLRDVEGMGAGDPKLFAAVGAWLGWQQLPFVILGAGLLGIAAVVAHRFRGRTVASDDRLPLGSLMAVTSWPLWLLSLTGGGIWN